MKVEFCGDVRQYRNIQKEIDANLREVLLMGSYVQGHMLKRFQGFEVMFALCRSAADGEQVAMPLTHWEPTKLRCSGQTCQQEKSFFQCPRAPGNIRPDVLRAKHLAATAHSAAGKAKV